MKLNRLFIPLLFAFVLSGCEKAIEPFHLSPEYYTSENKGLKSVNYGVVETKKEEKASFVAVVYTSGCTSCSTFSYLAESYANDNNLQFYSVDYKELRAYDPALAGDLKTAPAVLLFDQGVNVASLKSSDTKQKEYFIYYESFKQWFETYIIITPPEV